MRKDTSWQKVAGWYNKSVSDQGQYFHQHVVIPKSLKLLDLKPTSKLLDLGCGQGVLARKLPKGVEYLGVDLAPDLIKFAKKYETAGKANFMVGDISQKLPFSTTDFTHAVVMLALQNVEDMPSVIANASKHLKVGGKLLLVLNHPSFRIPRQTAWGIEEQNKQQYRKVFRYMSPQKIPIDMTPGSHENHKLTWSFHHPLSDYFGALRANGFVVNDLEEWVSDKQSTGKAAKMENRGRGEIPVFMAILATKK